MPDATSAAGILEGPPSPGGAADALVRGVAWVAAGAVLLLLPPSGLLQRVVLGVAGAAVLWLLWPVRTTPRERGASPLLLVTGVLMLGSLFLFANPKWGALSTEWPWGQWIRAKSWIHRTDLLLWVVVACFAMVVGAGERGRRLAPALVVALVFLSSRTQSGSGGAGNYVRIERLNLAWTVSASALGAGLLRIAGRGASGRGLARVLCLAGALGIVSVYAAWYPSEEGQAGASIRFYAHEYVVVWDRVFLGGERDPELLRKFLQQIWAVLVPFACQVLAVASGLVLALLPSSPGTRGRRWLASVAWLLLLLTWLLAPRAGTWFDRSDFEERGATKVAEVLGELFIRSGLCIWMALSGTVLRILGSFRERSTSAPAPLDLAGGGDAVRPAGRWPYAVGAALALFLLHACFHPVHGIVAPRWPADVVREWDWDRPELANLSFQGIFLVAMLVATSAFSRGIRLGTAMLIVAWLVLWPLSASDQRMYEVETWVPMVAAALAAAGAGALAAGDRGRAAPFLAASGGLVLLGLLVYPVYVPIPTGTRSEFVGPVYEAYLPTELIGKALQTDDLKELLLGLLVPWRMGVILVTLLSVTSLLAVLGVGRRWTCRTVVVLFLLLLAYPVLHAMIPGAGGEAFVRPEASGLAAWEQRLGGALKKYETPYLLGFFAAVSTLLRPTARSAGRPRSSDLAPAPTTSL